MSGSEKKSMKTRDRGLYPLLLSVAAVVLALVLSMGVSFASDTVPPADAVKASSGGQVPGNWSGNLSDAEIWRQIRRGVQGTVSIPDKKAAVLVQSDGDAMRAIRNGYVSRYGIWVPGAMIGLLALFYLFRGRIAIEGGPSDKTIERFNVLERFVHWLTASSFIVLALTGLNLMFGRYFMPALIGKDAFATFTHYGKLSHHFVAFSFMVGLTLMFLMWVKDNIPSRVDMEWMFQAGGLLSKDKHPPSERFNAGQKLIFWFVIVAGLSMTFTGLILVFPFALTPLGEFVSVIWNFGIGTPGELTPLQVSQIALIWHGIVALAFIAVIIAHIYIGTAGMEGAIDAVGTGQVDLNWAKQHHNLWVEQQTGEKVRHPAE